MKMSNIFRHLWQSTLTLIALASLLTVAACQTPSAGFCSIAKPHRHSAATVAVMTDAEVRQELSHNKQGAALCKWKP